jgi:hypothetical protein
MPYEKTAFSSPSIARPSPSTARLFRLSVRPPARTARLVLMAAAAWLGLSNHSSLAGVPSEAAPASIASSNRPQKIRELVEDLGYGADIQHVDAAIPYLTAQVAPNDPAWNSSNPRWRSVSALIGQNLRADAQTQFSESEAAIVDNAVRAMSDGVVREDLDASLAFFGSPTGRRYLDLQHALMDLSVEVNLQRDASASIPSVENLDTRKRVLGFWLPIVFIHAMYGPGPADRALDSAYRSFSRPRGPQLDALAQRYAEDFPQFEQFLNSASFRRIVEAEKATEHVMPEPDLVTFFTAEAKQHASEWRAASQRP